MLKSVIMMAVLALNFPADIWAAAQKSHFGRTEAEARAQQAAIKELVELYNTKIKTAEGFNKEDYRTFLKYMMAEELLAGVSELNNKDIKKISAPIAQQITTLEKQLKLAHGGTYDFYKIFSKHLPYSSFSNKARAGAARYEVIGHFKDYVSTNTDEDDVPPPPASEND